MIMKSKKNFISKIEYKNNKIKNYNRKKNKFKISKVKF